MAQIAPLLIEVDEMIIDNLTIFGVLIAVGVALVVSRLASKGVSGVAPKSRRPLHHH